MGGVYESGRPGIAPLPFTMLLPELCCEYIPPKALSLTHCMHIKFLIRKYTKILTVSLSLGVGILGNSYFFPFDLSAFSV